MQSLEFPQENRGRRQAEKRSVIGYALFKGNVVKTQIQQAFYSDGEIHVEDEAVTMPDDVRNRFCDQYFRGIFVSTADVPAEILRQAGKNESCYSLGWCDVAASCRVIITQILYKHLHIIELFL